MSTEATATFAAFSSLASTIVTGRYLKNKALKVIQKEDNA